MNFYSSRALRAHDFTGVRVGHAASGLIGKAPPAPHTAQFCARGRVSAADWQLLSPHSFWYTPFRLDGAMIFNLLPLFATGFPDPAHGPNISSSIILHPIRSRLASFSRKAPIPPRAKALPDNASGRPPIRNDRPVSTPVADGRGKAGRAGSAREAAKRGRPSSRTPVERTNHTSFLAPTWPLLPHLAFCAKYPEPNYKEKFGYNQMLEKYHLLRNIGSPPPKGEEELDSYYQ